MQELQRSKCLMSNYVTFTSEGHPNKDALYPPLPGSVLGEPPGEGDLYPKLPKPFKWEEIGEEKETKK